MRYILPLIIGCACGLLGLWPIMATPAEIADVDALTLAAEALDRGDQKDAVRHMQTYVSLHPTAVMPRAHLADMLVRQGQPAEAKKHYEQFLVDTETSTGAPAKHRVHCHTRLMRIAEDADDVYGEHLNRGIGLLLAADHDEETLSQALKALNIARGERPKTARVYVYLAEVYRRLGQAGVARQAIITAKANLPDPTLTPHERQKLLEDSAHTSR
jgi:predicted Zn-dependent protease